MKKEVKRIKIEMTEYSFLLCLNNKINLNLNNLIKYKKCNKCNKFIQQHFLINNSKNILKNNEKNILKNNNEKNIKKNNLIILLFCNIRNIRINLIYGEHFFISF